LIDFATSTEANQWLPFTKVAEKGGVIASVQTLHNVFSIEGYNHRIAYSPPFLSTKAKET